MTPIRKAICDWPLPLKEIFYRSACNGSVLLTPTELAPPHGRHWLIFQAHTAIGFAGAGGQFYAIYDKSPFDDNAGNSRFFLGDFKTDNYGVFPWVGGVSMITSTAPILYGQPRHLYISHPDRIILSFIAQPASQIQETKILLLDETWDTSFEGLLF